MPQEQSRKDSRHLFAEEGEKKQNPNKTKAHTSLCIIGNKYLETKKKNQQKTNLWSKMRLIAWKHLWLTLYSL